MPRRVGSPNAEVMADTAAEKSAAESAAGASARGPSSLLPTPVSYRGALPPRPARLTGPSGGVHMAPTRSEVLEALRPVEDPEIHQSIVDLGMVRTIEVTGPRVAVQVALTVAGCPLRSEITNRVTGAVRELPGVEDVDLDFTVMTDEERTALRERLHGDPASTAGSQHAHGHAEG